MQEVIEAQETLEGEGINLYLECSYNLFEIIETRRILKKSH